MKSIITVLFLSLILSSCAFVRSVSQTSIPAQKGKLITVESTRNIFFFFNFSTDYVDHVNQKLLDQCPNGSVTGVFTKDVHIVYFPIIYSRDVITAQGYCNE